MFSYRLITDAIGPHEEIHVVTAGKYCSAYGAAMAGFRAYVQELKALGHDCEIATLDILDSSDPSFCDTYEIRY